MEFGCVMAGGSEQQLLRYFRESASSILQLSEVQQWWRQGGSKGKEEEVQELLQQLVERREVGCRVLTAGGSQYTVYWLKKQHDAGQSSTPVRTPTQHEKTPMSVSLRERLKRSRPRFVSPLLSSAKKPRLAVAAPGRPPVGKLDFTVCDQSSCAVTEKVEEKTKEEKNLKSPQKTQEKDEGTSRNQSLEQSERGEVESRTSGVNQEDCSNGGKRTCSVAGTGTGVGSTGEGGVELLVAERTFLESKLRAEEEKLRKLRMVKLYHTKNDLCQLDTLIQKWRDVMQEAAESLLASSTLQPLPSMAQLLDHLHIDHKIIHYSAEEEAFY